MNINQVVSSNKSLVSAVFGALAMRYNLGDANFEIFGRQIPAWIYGAVISGTGSMVVDLVSATVLPHIPQSTKLQKLESIVLHIVSAGAYFPLVTKILNSDLNMRETRLLAVSGAVVEVASQFVHEMTCKRGGGCGNEELLF